MKLRTPNPIDRHVSAQIRKHRLLAGMSQEHLAAKLGITFQQVQKYENATNRISAGRLYQLSCALGVPVTAFYAGLHEAHHENTEANSLLTMSGSEDGIKVLRAFQNICPGQRKAVINLARDLAKPSSEAAE